MPYMLPMALTACLCLGQSSAQEDHPSHTEVDAKSLHRKVLCGYQGWFRCPKDPTDRGWVHWSRDAKRITPETLTFEMWPDLSEYSDEEKYPAPGFTHRDGQPAFLFSSANQRTVERHFDWMAKYGIDGALVQRFVAGVQDPDSTRVLGYAREAANRTGRVFAVEYDMTGTPPDKLFDLLTRDWKRLVEEMKVTADPRYLHHNGLPVLAIWGFFSERFDAALANRIIDFFKKDPRYRVTLIGGCQWPWREEKNAAWAKVFRRFDVLSPWNVGNCVTSGGVLHAKTDQWPADLAESRRAGMLFMPVVFPGFSWDNLQRKKPGTTNIPRRRGEFYWEQFSTAARLGIDMVKVAMFDEVDEGTAIFKVSNDPPTQGHFVTYEGLPSDWYLRLTGEGAKLIRGERRNTGRIPIKP
jgi:Glycosyl hydrolase family 99